MQAITTIGLDIAKSVFQVHGVDADGQVIIRRQYSTLYSALPLSHRMTLPGNQIYRSNAWVEGAPAVRTKNPGVSSSRSGASVETGA
jgi:hypothetical protein